MTYCCSKTRHLHHDADHRCGCSVSSPKVGGRKPSVMLLRLSARRRRGKQQPPPPQEQAEQEQEEQQREREKVRARVPKEGRVPSRLNTSASARRRLTMSTNTQPSASRYHSSPTAATNHAPAISGPRRGMWKVTMLTSLSARAMASFAHSSMTLAGVLPGQDAS